MMPQPKEGDGILEIIQKNALSHEPNEEKLEKLDLNNNGKPDTIISFVNPVRAFLDLNENGIAEIEYLFNGAV